MSLAFALLERGRVKAALTEADRAAAALRGLPAVRLATQRALILQRTGQLGQALAAYAAALPALRRFGDDLWEARLLNNRGLLHADQGTLTAAEADLHRARDLHTARGSEMLAAEAEWNLGVVAARRGDAPTALARFDRAGARHRRQGTPNPQLLLDRCHVLLGVGLVAEARQTADRAVRDLRDTGQGADLAEAQLLLARATLADGAAGEARTVAAAAQAAFTRQGRPGWSLLARSIRLRAAEAGGARPRRLLPAALECAAHLAAAGWRIAELDARLVAARAALGDGDLDTARDQLTLAAAGRRAGSLELRLRAWYALALLRNAGGDARGTQAALRAGLAVLDRQRAALGATELRVHLTAHGAELAGTGLGLALAAGNARGVLTWAERWRAGALRLHPARPPADSELAAALVEARRLADAFLHARLEGAAPPTSAALRAAEQRVVSASRTTRSVLHQPSAPPPTAAELAAELRGAVLVEYVTHDGQLLAVTVGARRTRLHRLGPLVAVTGRIEAAQFALVRLVRGFGTDRALAMVRIAALAAAARLDELLLAPLRREIGDLLRRTDPALLRVVVVGRDRVPDAFDSVTEPVSAVIPPAAWPVTPSADPRFLATVFVRGECLSDDPRLRKAYGALCPEQRAALHDARATELEALDEPSLGLGAIPFHREQGSDPAAAAGALRAALEHCVLMGFYDAVLDLGRRVFTVLDWDTQPDECWLVTAKVSTALTALDRPDEAAEMYDEACARSTLPSVHLQAAYGRAMLYTRFYDRPRQDQRQAKAWINAAIAISSLLPGAQQRAINLTFHENGLALIEMHLGDAAEALRLVTAGLDRLEAELGPDEQTLHRSVLRYNRAQLLAKMRRLDEAIAEYTQAIHADPHHSEYYLERAGLYRRAGRVAEAMADYGAAMRLSPPYPEPYYNRGDLAMEIGDVERALADFSYVLELDPQFLDAYVNRAGIRFEQGDVAGAAADVAIGLRLDVQQPHLHCLRGLIAQEQDRPAEACTAFDTALRLDPSLIAALAARAALAFDGGDAEAAIEDLTRALESSDDPTLRANRSLAFERTGRWGAAAEDCAKAITGGEDDQEELLRRRTRCLLQAATAHPSNSQGLEMT